MQKKRHKPPRPSAMELASSVSDQLWVRPNSNLVQQRKEIDARNINPANAKKLLELADVALGLTKGKAAMKPKLLPAQARHQWLVERKSKRQTN
jgi:hypothetical protein